MPTNASILADYASGIGTQGTTLTIDGDNQSVGIGTTLPSSTLDVNGDVNVTGVSTFQDDIFLGDDDKINIGDGNDLEIYHDGSNSYISDQGTGNLKVLTSTFVLKNAIDSKTMLQSVAGQYVRLYYDDATKLETTGDGIEVTGVVTATSFSGDGSNLTGIATAQGLTGNPSITVTDITATGNVSIAGTLTYEDVTNVDSIGIITAQSGIDVTGGGINVTGVSTFTGDVRIADKIRHLNNASTSIRFPAADTFTVETAGSERVRVTNIGDVGIGTDNPTTKLDVNGGLRFAGEALENVNITAGTLLANQNIDLTNGMVHYFTSNETGISTANIRIDGSTSLDSTMNTGNTAAVTILTTPNNAGYSTCVNIDGSYNVVQWLGGTAPSTGGASGIDAYTYQIIKTGSATFTVLGAVNNFA